MTDEEYGAEVRKAKAARDEARQAVLDWMDAEGAAGRLRNNRHAPGWVAYEESERRLSDVLNGVLS